MGQKTVLGKGLASLLPGSPVLASGSFSQETGNHERHPGIAFLPIEDLKVNDYQPRRSFDDGMLQELAQSIRTNGVIQPLVVRRTPQGYQLVAGERRLRASKIAGLKQVPVVIRRSTDKEALELALIENIQRENLNCIDEARAYQQLLNEFQLTQEEVALRVGKERATVANHLRLLRLDEPIIDDLKRGSLTFGHGKALLMIEESDARLELRRRIIEGRLSVRQAEAEAGAIKSRLQSGGAPVDSVQSSPGQSDPVQERFFSLSQSLTRQWSAKVELKGTRKKGKILIHYSDSEQLERILTVMQNSSVWQNPRT